MHIRRLSGCLVLALAALAVLPVVTSTPTAAHAGFTSIADDAAADRTATINGTTMKVRVLRPSTSASKPAGGWPLVVYMAGDLKNRCANVNETINSTGVVTRPSWYTRKQLAADGFAVLSFNARGYPAPYNAGVNPSTSTTSGCDALEDAKDAIEKSPGVPENTGWDIAGPLDKQDVHDLIEWAVASYTDPNCASPCIDGSKVGILGAGADSRRALHMAVPLSANPQFNQRVMGVVAVGYEELAVRNLKDLSSDGAVTPTFRKVDQGLWPYAADMHVGHMGRTDASVATNVNELLRAEYLNDTVADSTKTWFDDRAIVDDDVLDTPADQDPRVDKAGLITMPVFMANAFLDGDAGIATATLAWNKLATSDKYLYLGPCGSSYSHLSSGTGPCLSSTNAPNLRNKVHAFLDRHVRGDTTVSVGGSVHYAIPPATNPLSSDNWSVQTGSTWPPDGSSSTYCIGVDGTWHDAATCAEQTGTREISNSVTATPQTGFCVGSTYGATEKAEYTSPVLPGKMVGLEMDFWLLSSSTRSQVYVDVWDVDNATGGETRVWQGTAQVVPTARNVSPLTGVRYKFRPGGNAWTFAANHKIRIKITANYKSAFAQELIPATYYIWHDYYNNGTAPVKVTVTWAT